MRYPEVADHPAIARLSPDDRRVLAPLFEIHNVEPGTHVIREGDRDRVLYLVLDGVADVVRGRVDVGRVVAGQHFGELALVGERPRAASVIAAQSLWLARMTAARFDELTTSHPAVAVHFIRSLLRGVGDRLEAMTDGVGALLATNLLRRRTSLDIRVEGEPQTVPVGTLARDLLPESVDGHVVVAAALDRQAVSLLTPITSECELRAVTTKSWEGRRIYRGSLALLLLEAARQIAPEIQIRVDYSLGFAQRIYVRGNGGDFGVLAKKLDARMRDIAEAAKPIRLESWAVDEALDKFEELGERGTVELLRTSRQRTVLLVALGETYALYKSPLVPTTGMLRGFEIAADSDGLLLVYGPNCSAPGREQRVLVVSDARAASRQTRELTRHHDRWLEALGVSTVGEYNRMCLRGDVAALINVAEGFHEKMVGRIADEIRELADRVKIVSISGPSASGKTTFIKRLKVQLQVNGVRPIGVSLDDYYCDRRATPLDANGEYDYEAVEALRLDLLHEHIGQLMAGDAVHTARYDFKTGLSHPDGGRMLRMDSSAVLMLEGIHGLNPRVLPAELHDSAFLIFVCPLAQLPIDAASRVHASDMRLLRRIVRDRHGRATPTADTIRRWPAVRSGERRHIYPFQDNAHAIFDSSLIYELSVLKVYAERYLMEVPRTSPEYLTACRLLGLTDSFVTIYPDHVPPTSILREFVGGRGFEY